MKDFELRNDTKLLFRNDPVADLIELTAGKKVLFVYGGGSVKRNGCYEDVKNAVAGKGGAFYEAGILPVSVRRLRRASVRQSNIKSIW